MTHIPFPHAATRAEARDNAIELVKLAEDNILTGGPDPQGITSLALVWSRIAETFPWDSPAPEMSEIQQQLQNVRMTDDEDYRPNAASPPDETMVLQTVQQPRIGHVMASGTTGTITVDATAWDVLRALAVRYVMSSLERRVSLSLSEAQAEGVSLELVFMPDEPIVHVTVAQG